MEEEFPSSVNTENGLGDYFDFFVPFANSQALSYLKESFKKFMDRKFIEDQLKQLVMPSRKSVAHWDTRTYDGKRLISILECGLDNSSKRTNLTIKTSSEFKNAADLIYADSNTEHYEFMPDKHAYCVFVEPDCASSVLRGADIYEKGIESLKKMNKAYAELCICCAPNRSRIAENKKYFPIAKGYFIDENHKHGRIKINASVFNRPAFCLKGDKLLFDTYPSMFAIESLDCQPGDRVAFYGFSSSRIIYCLKKMDFSGNIDIFHYGRRKWIQRMEKFIYLWNVQSYVSLFENITNHDKKYKKLFFAAPSTCTGKLPVIFKKLSIKQIKGIIKHQKNIFSRFVQLAADDAELVYFTESILIEENEEQIRSILESHRKMKIIELPVTQNCDNGLPLFDGSELTKRFGPFSKSGDTDGGFVAKFRISNEDNKPQLKSKKLKNGNRSC
ncbi:hypothetical protein ACOME3_000611 [Neoechinorhynchus agilis]